MAKLDLNRLQLVVAVAKHLNFRRAASELGMSPAALSERVRAFESQLGVRVFNRTTRSVSLTEAGARLLGEAGPALSVIDSAVSNAAGSVESPTGTIRINGPRPAVEFRLTPLVIGFLQQYPGMTVEVISDDGLIDIVKAGFDAGVRYGEMLNKDMIAVSLGGPQRMIVVGSPDYFARHGRPSHPEELAQHRCFCQVFPRGNRLAWSFEKNGVEEMIHPQGPVATSEPTVQLQAAERGLGLAMLFEEHCGVGIAAGRLETILEDWCAPFAGPFLYYPERRLMPAGLRAFVSFIFKST